MRIGFARLNARLSFEESSFLVDETTKFASRIQQPTVSDKVSSLITDETNSSLKKKSGGLKLGGKRAARLLFETPDDPNAFPAMTLKETISPKKSRFSLKDFDPDEHASLHEKNIVRQMSKEAAEEQEERSVRRKKAEEKERQARARQSSIEEIKGVKQQQQPVCVATATPSSSSTAKPPEPRVEVLLGVPELSPDAALARQRALTMKSVTSSVSAAMLLAEIRLDMNAVTSATVLHRLGRHCRPQERLQLLADERFQKLCGMVHKSLEELNAQALCGVFWGLVKLNHRPMWMADLGARLSECTPEMSAHQVSTALYLLGP